MAQCKESTSQCRRHRSCGLDPWVWKIPWSRKWQPASAFLSGESHGQRNLAGYSPWGCKESDTTEATQHRCTASTPFFPVSNILPSPVFQKLGSVDCGRRVRFNLTLICQVRLETMQLERSISLNILSISLHSFLAWLLSHGSRIYWVGQKVPSVFK